MNPSPSSALRTAVVAGGSGLVGRHLLDLLLASAAYGQVISLTRRPQPRAGLVELAGDLLSLSPIESRLAADDAYCCLGTTTAKAGRDGLEQVDYAMVVEFARAARAAGARQFLVVSAIGAALNSPSHYSRVKARMERDVTGLGYAAVHILRPSLLLGARAESRPAERFAQRLSPWLAPLMRGPLLPYRPIAAAEVAQAMVELALAQTGGVHLHTLPRKPS